MTILRIPRLDLTSCKTVFDKISSISNKGLKLNIDTINWPEQFSKKLPVSVTLVHDNYNVFIYYQIEGEKLRAANTEDNMPVWQDSCVEFFMKRIDENVYRNFEFNVLGVLLAAEHETRNISARLSEKAMASIKRFSNVSHYYQSGTELSNWSLLAEIPKDVIGFDMETNLSGESIKANFYKCADESSEPHYISWSPIDTPKPDFHVPQFFKQLTFE